MRQKQLLRIELSRGRGGSLYVSVSPSDCVLSIKHKLETLTDIPTLSQILYHAATQLSDSTPLHEFCHTAPVPTLSLHVPIRGGASRYPKRKHKQQDYKIKSENHYSKELVSEKSKNLKQKTKFVIQNSQKTSTNTQTYPSKASPYPTKGRISPGNTQNSLRNPQTPPSDTQTLLSNTFPYKPTSQGTLPVTQTLHSNGLPFNPKQQTTFPDTLNFHRETETFLPKTQIFSQKPETSSPDSEIYTPKHFNSIPSLSTVSKKSGLFTIIETNYSNLSEKSFLIYEINVANEAHQIPAPGLNFITKCRCQTKNEDYIIHRSGLIPANNGYCNLDREIHRLMCPLCGKRVKPDPWLSVGFYQCKFKITFQTNSAKMKDGPKIITGRANGNDLKFAKYFPPGGSKYFFLDVEVKATIDLTFL